MSNNGFILDIVYENTEYFRDGEGDGKGKDVLDPQIKATSCPLNF